MPLEIFVPSLRAFGFACLLAFSLLGSNAKSQDQSARHTVVPLDKFLPGQWVEIVWGDYTKPGEPFVLRIHNDAGYIVVPHTHPIDENITVVKGSWALGMGRRFDRSALKPMEVGSFGIAPRNMAHFAWAKTDSILQIHGIGPFSDTVVDPVYELTDQGVFLLTTLLRPGVPTSSSPPDCFAIKIGTHVRSNRGEGAVIRARCSPANKITQYWVQNPNGGRFWATLQELKQ